MQKLSGFEYLDRRPVAGDLCVGPAEGFNAWEIGCLIGVDRDLVYVSLPVNFGLIPCFRPQQVFCLKGRRTQKSFVGILRHRDLSKNSAR